MNIILNLGSMVGYFALKTPLKMCVTQKTRILFIFPGISHFEDIGQGNTALVFPGQHWTVCAICTPVIHNVTFLVNNCDTVNT